VTIGFFFGQNFASRGASGGAHVNWRVINSSWIPISTRNKPSNIDKLRL